MLNKNDVKTEYITSKDLAEQTKIILAAMDERFGDLRTELKTDMDGLRTELKTDMDGLRKELKADINDVREELYIVRKELKADINNVQTELSDELYRVRDELKSDINDVQTSTDKYVKAQEDFKQEFVIAKEEIRLIKQAFKQKIGVEIQAC